MTDTIPPVYGGVDTHKDIHVAAVVDQVGRILETDSFPTNSRGLSRLMRWIESFGPIAAIGVEGTGSYGHGLAHHLTTHDHKVIEVNRPNRQMRRRRGKNDTVDAEAAARAALSGQEVGEPKSHDGLVESIRLIRVAFTSTRTNRTRVTQQIDSIIITAPAPIRSQLEALSATKPVQTAAGYRPGSQRTPFEAAKVTLRMLARQYQQLTDDLEELQAELDELTRQGDPALLQVTGVGTDTASTLLAAVGDNPYRLKSEASFAALCGISPVEASSGRTINYRLNRGGNRQANHALWRIALVRMSKDETTKRYVRRRTEEGKSRRAIIRCLKRYIAREIYRTITDPPEVVETTDLRPRRMTLGKSMKVFADTTNIHINTVSRIERGITFDRDLVDHYKNWLETQEQAA